MTLSSWIFLLNILFYVSGGPLDDPEFIKDRNRHPGYKDDQKKMAYHTEEKDASYWENLGKERVKKVIENELNLNQAKNVILFLGDGMSITTLVASRIYMGQLNGETGEEVLLSFEKFPSVGLAKTYCVDSQVADSACTATAYLGGVKGNIATIGVSGHVPTYGCQQMQNTSFHVKSIAQRFMDNGRSAGIVTTTRVTHASPAGAYAHTAYRDWEADSDILADGHNPTFCRDIAHQLIHGETGKDLKVILGGGRREFRPNNVTDEEGTPGRRFDNRDLIEEWKQQNDKARRNSQYVWNRQQLLNDVRKDTDYLLGLFEGNHCKYNLETNDDEPSFEEMVEVAIKRLSKDENGYFLFAEGGRIDHAHHDGHAKIALDETVQFSKGVAKAISMTSEEDTLIIVTADHSHVMTVSGYPKRGNPIFSRAGTADDGIPYMTLSYANGPGYRKEVDGHRVDVTLQDTEDPRFLQPAMVPLESETHGGEDIAVFANGPWNHLFTGVYEQSSIPHLIRYAACLDDEPTAC